MALMSTHTYFPRDYEPIPELDRYDEEMLDNKAYPHLSAQQRRAAESEIKKRSKNNKKRKRFAKNEEDEQPARVPSALRLPIEGNALHLRLQVER